MQQLRKLRGRAASRQPDAQPVAASQGRRFKRAWEVWPGNNRFFLDGFVMTGPKVENMGFTFLLISLPCFITFGAAEPDLRQYNGNSGSTVVGVLLYLVSMTFLILTGTCDPGIIPRYQSHPHGVEFDQYGFRKPPPKSQTIIVGGKPVVLQYCVTCNIFQPPRCSHCTECDNCVERFDHHCPWVGTCVGKRNYRHFCTFLYATFGLILYLLSANFKHLEIVSASDSPGSVFVLVYLFIGMWFLVALCGFHVYLGWHSMTTYEQIKHEFSELGNPYSRGPLENFKQILFSAQTPSALHHRAIVSTSSLSSVAPASGTGAGGGGGYNGAGAGYSNGGAGGADAWGGGTEEGEWAISSSGQPPAKFDSTSATLHRYASESNRQPGAQPPPPPGSPGSGTEM